MSFAHDHSNPLWVGDPPTDLNLFRRGFEYLRSVQDFMPEPGMMDILDNARDRPAVCTWVGANIAAVNQALQQCLTACHECFHPQERRPMQIFAAPLAQSLRLDGFCNISTFPLTILIDVGRVAPQDWLSLVAHEYSHAHIGSPGHHQSFAIILSHLCLGLGLEPPKEQSELFLRSFPPYTPMPNPLAFWKGEAATKRQ